MSRPRQSRSWRSYLRQDDDGAIAVMAAVLAAALVLAGSLAVDVGRVAYTSRDQQGATDRAALDGARAIEETSAATASDFITGDLRDAVDAALGRNQGAADRTSGPRSLTRLSLVDRESATLCRVDLDSEPTTVTGTECDRSLDDLDAKGVEVRTASHVDFLLSLGLQTEEEVTSRSVAALEPTAAISAASSTAELDGGAVNALLTALTGSSISLDVVHHEGLVGSFVDLRLLALNLADLGLDVGSVEDLVDLKVEAVELFEAMLLTLKTQAVQEGSDPLLDGAIAALEDQLLPNLTVDSLPKIDLAEILSLETAGDAGLDLGVDAFSLVMAGLQAANTDSGVELDLGVPWVSDVDLTVVEPPVIAVGPARQGPEGWKTVAETAQIELDVTVLPDDMGVSIGGLVSGLLDGLLNLLGLGSGGASLAEEPLQLSLNTGEGTVSLTGISCTGDGALDVRASSAAANLTIPRTDLVDVEASLLGIPVASSTIGVELAEDDGQLGSESGEDTLSPVPSESTRVSGSVLGLGALLDGLEPVVEGELLGEVDIDAGELLDPLLGILNELLTPIEDVVLMPLLDVLGIDLGVVEARALDQDCSTPQLVE